MDSTLRLIRGSRVDVTIPMNSSADDIKYAARATIAAHYRHFSPDTEVSLRYPDGTIIDTLPEGGMPFNL